MENDSQVYRFAPGRTPLLVSIPHCGTLVPPDLRASFTAEAQLLADTDWYVDQLYHFAVELGAGIIAARWSRYVIDLNRAPDGQALYAGANNTELCPVTTFDEQPIYLPGSAPDVAEIGQRRVAYWEPYHDKIAEEMKRLHDRHGVAVLWEAHSIRSHVPRFFEGRLTDLNLGTAEGRSAAPEGRSAAPELIAAVAAAARSGPFELAVDGRFKGGYLTRSNGRPSEGWHALQMELAQDLYMEETPPFAYRQELAAELRPTLRAMLEAALRWAASPAR
ncbi:N-formylglutamate deformylase [Algihabitans albus]|uniref:N-formylglutamate deformylase n=1 Tax=Algihabitans albus TaxID=2164067 RepID=UPI000E5C9079|nr:N-formylglutamate deformylase [Algihabitans albus]